MKKKGSLSLSIEAIVIIVIAFVVLGLGLAFVRDQINKAKESTGEVQEQIRQQVLDDLRRGDKKLNFPTDEIKVNKGESKQLTVGVKNLEEKELRFKIKIKFIESNIFVENKVNVKDKEGFEIGKFIWDGTTQILGPTDTNVYPIKFIAGKHAETYTFQVVIEREDGTEYTVKSFFITIL